MIAHRRGSLTVPVELPGIKLSAATRYLKALFYGFSGVGKSWLLKSFLADERTRPALWLDPTGGTTGILDDPLVQEYAEVRTCEDSSSILSVTDWLIAEASQGRFPYKALLVDDYTESFGLTKKKLAVELYGKLAEGIEGVDHARLYERTRTVFRALRRVSWPAAGGGASMHVVVTCWPEKEANHRGIDMMVPRFAGKFGYEAPGYFDVVGYMEASTKREHAEGGDKKRVFTNTVTLQTDGQLLVKDRFNRLGSSMAMPTATKILDALWHDNSNTNKE